MIVCIIFRPSRPFAVGRVGWIHHLGVILDYPMQQEEHKGGHKGKAWARGDEREEDGRVERRMS